MPEWIPTRNSAKGRLVFAGLELFGAASFDDVGVSALAGAAGVTTGALYHHFGSKAGLYDVVRTDVERRVLDRIEGAVAARPDDAPAEAASAALVVAFDYLTGAGYSRLLGADPSGRTGDPVCDCLAAVLDGDGVPRARLVCAAWREALRAVADGVPVADARAAFAALRLA